MAKISPDKSDKSESIDDAVANSSIVKSLKEKVNSIEGTLRSHGGDISNMKAQVSSTDTNVKQILSLRAILGLERN